MFMDNFRSESAMMSRPLVSSAGLKRSIITYYYRSAWSEEENYFFAVFPPQLCSFSQTGSPRSKVVRVQNGGVYTVETKKINRVLVETDKPNPEPRWRPKRIRGGVASLSNQIRMDVFPRIPLRKAEQPRFAAHEKWECRQILKVKKYESDHNNVH